MFTISCPPKVIWLGRKGENEFRTIEVEVSEWLRDYPNGTISVVYHRPDGAIYLPTVTTSGNVTSWLITATDTAIAGKGEVEYRIIDGDVIGKSVKMPTMVSAAINATTDAPAPPPEDWTAVAAEILGMIGDLDNLDTEAKNNLVAAINEAFNSGGGGGGGTSDHRQLSNRDAANQHPISAITGLQTALDAKGTYSKPSGGIPKTDLASDVQTSLSRADTALQTHQSLAGYATESYVQNYHDNTKQDVITDLASIRSGAALGATAVQPTDYASDTAAGVVKTTSQFGLTTNYSTGALMGVTKSAADYATAQAHMIVSKGTLDNLGLAKSADIPTAVSELTNDSGYLTDAPSDGKQYARKDGAWSEVISGGGGAEAFIVNITQSGGVFSADKTNAEIDAAWLANKEIFAVINGDFRLQCVESAPLVAVFSANTKYSDIHNTTVRIANNIVTVDDTTLQPTTITDTAGYYTTDTVEGALAEIGGTLDGLEDAINAIRGVS